MTYLLSSAGALIVDRNTWHTRADTAYDSGTWGTGTHWHTRYDQKETERATWESRADQAWGLSRNWPDGESWEQAYNRVLPPASIQGTDTNMGNVSTTRGTWVRASGGYVCPITGNWSLEAEARGSAWSSQEQCGGQVRIVWPGNSITGKMTHFRPEPYFDVTGTMHLAYGTGFVTSGQTLNIEILVNADTAGNSLTFNQIVLRARFIPVAANPH